MTHFPSSPITAQRGNVEAGQSDFGLGGFMMDWAPLGHPESGSRAFITMR